MTSEPREAFVWAWLPGADAPVVAGRLQEAGEVVAFAYGRSYLARPDGVPFYGLPLTTGAQMPQTGPLHGCFDDAGPDAWGQKVVLNRLMGHDAQDTAALTPLRYLLESGSDRVGAIDFQASATEYRERGALTPTLDDLARSADLVDQGEPLPAELADALLRGSSIGGARPKATLRDGDRFLIAKFASSTDTFGVVQAEYVAMRLARLAGLDVAGVRLTEALGRKVLMVERFDRETGGHRRMVVSALTILGLDPVRDWSLMSYATLADHIRQEFEEPRKTLHELFGRIAFNILVSNTDDHARNHAAFWDGVALTLTPAYDICPQRRAGGEARQVMGIGRDGWRMSNLAGLVERCGVYQLDGSTARSIIDGLVDAIADHFAEVCDEAGISEVDRRLLATQQFCNPYAFYDYGTRPSLS